jgi:hypothetical protein
MGKGIGAFFAAFHWERKKAAVGVQISVMEGHEQLIAVAARF